MRIASTVGARSPRPIRNRILYMHQPGVGVGGHYIPIYPYFLLAGVEPGEQQSSGIPELALPRFARLISDGMPTYAAQRLEAVIGSLAGRAVLLLGVAYRGNVREVAFTSARLLQKALVERGALVYVDDPLFSYDELQDLGYTPLVQDHLDKIEAIILQAGHQAYRQFDFNLFQRCKMVLDGRRALHRQQVEALGMRYMAIGDGNHKERS